MKKFLFGLLILCLGACKPVPKINLAQEIVGNWELISINFDTKAAKLGTETIDIRLTFNADNSFVLNQKMGEAGRYTEFKGTWTITDNILSGVYSDKAAWASSYQISITDKTTLTMIASNGEAENYVYKKVINW